MLLQGRGIIIKLSSGLSTTVKASGLHCAGEQPGLWAGGGSCLSASSGRPWPSVQHPAAPRDTSWDHTGGLWVSGRSRMIHVPPLPGCLWRLQRGARGPCSRDRGLLTAPAGGVFPGVDPAAVADDRLPAHQGPGFLPAQAGWGWAAASSAPAAAGAPFTLHHRQMTAGTVGVHYRDHELLEVI